ncbi:radical SAM protein [Methanoplanus sp. FWC-SCC4]|uniref:Radical SAM protein n=1 Tax=Methanochimaera problematica TaxID=2609417 RepID=A0AA97FB26_9EURY|nr:radical SAM protein [Methanoplanus sp. FWC-SCC4]WOF15287.1 radical SAM protein [Methanoplanus sp. FWC-SCC4]
MKWKLFKASLLEIGSARITGEPADASEQSHAGPGAGEKGSVFFSAGGKRVRLSIDDNSPVEIHHFGDGRAELIFKDTKVSGVIEKTGFHCPRQAYITVSEGCIYNCRFCNVPSQPPRIKTPEEIVKMVAGVKDRIDCISITSGVIGNPKEDETRVLEVIKELRAFRLPIGVSIYPLLGTPKRLKDLGVLEIKFNLETATDELFTKMCPLLNRQEIMDALTASVSIFGKNRVFTNIILGLGETDDEMKQCIKELTQAGIIPVIRPLNPSGELSDLKRPSAKRILEISDFLEGELLKTGLSCREAKTMCTLCTGCDMVPGADS